MKKGKKAPVTLPPAVAAADTKRQSVLIGMALCLLIAVVYLKTLAPTIIGGDSGGAVAAAATWGVQHPPGYPLYTILGKLFSYLPIGTVGWRLNLFSACCSVGASGFIFSAARRWTKQSWAGVLAAGLFAFSPLVWLYAVTSEVFALNNLFIAVLLDLSARYAQDRESKLPYWMAFILGLGFSHHHTLVLYGLPLALWVLWTERQELTLKVFLKLAGVFALGLLPYVYLPIASYFIPEIAWGDQTTLQGFMKHFFRSEYGTFRLASSHNAESVSWITRVWIYFKQLGMETLIIGIPLAFIGLRSTLKRPAKSRIDQKRQHSLAWMWFGAWMLYLIVFCVLSNLRIDMPILLEVQARFWMQANIPVFIWIAIGAHALMTSACKRWGKALNFEKVFAVMASLLVVLQLGLHFRKSDQSQNDIVHRFGKQVLADLPQDALLIVSGDLLISTLSYVQGVENYRRDVRILGNEMLSYPWYRQIVERHVPGVRLPPGVQATASQSGYTLKDVLDLNMGRSKVFISDGFKLLESSFAKEYQAWPYGLSRWLLPAGQQPQINDWLHASQRNLNAAKTELKVGTHSDETWEHIAQSQYWYGLNFFGVGLANAGAKFGSVELLRTAERSFLELQAEPRYKEASLETNLQFVRQKLSEASK